MKLKIESIAYHRNGVCGCPFYTVLFTTDEQPTNRFLATVFDDNDGATSGLVSVLDIYLAHAGNIAFGENSWRGDVYEPELRKAISAWESEQQPTDAELGIVH